MAAFDVKRILSEQNRRLVRRLLSSIRSHFLPISTPTNEAPACNICGSRLRSQRELLSVREARSCSICGSTLRFRGLAAALQQEFDRDRRIRVLERIPARKSIRGIGMSDAGVYATALQRKFGYINTFFHQKPLLDIRSPAPEYLRRFDFVVSSDVLEHVDGPCQHALRNLRALLKPGGLLVLTVPYGFQSDTIEHYPELHDYRIEGEWDERILVNVTEDGREQRSTNLSVHGGDGSTLERRYYAFGAGP
jgi:SAM-dependent methyltransferase